MEQLAAFKVTQELYISRAMGTQQNLVAHMDTLEIHIRPPEVLYGPV